jgi:hypothetical protein
MVIVCVCIYTGHRDKRINYTGVGNLLFAVQNYLKCDEIYCYESHIMNSDNLTTGHLAFVMAYEFHNKVK